MFTIDLKGSAHRDKLLGCWIGKNAGGTLGTPVEEAWGREEPFDIWWYPDLPEGGLPNDDLEMQLVWLAALEEVGPNLRARDLARFWLDHIGYNFDEYGLSKTNLRLGLEPPVSGSYNNWFKDCMGSPIRTEVWACVAPGLPRLAARYAFEDAICDHAGGESVYGGLFNVAIQSSAFVISDRRKLIDIGLSYVPEGSQTFKAIRTALDAVDEGLDWKQARARVLKAVPHYIAQYSPINMGFQVIGLLLGKDFGDALCVTVNCGYDTDSSGGTIGSWLGIIEGKAQLPENWIAPFLEAIATNESWGGVRHLTDGTTSIPSTLTEVVDKLVEVAHQVIGSQQLLKDSVLEVREEDLYADESIRKMWSADPLTVDFEFSQFGISVRYSETPAVRAGSEVILQTVIRNPHPDLVDANASILVPAGWEAPKPQQVSLDAKGTATLSWKIKTPGRAQLENSNRLFFVLDADGFPQVPAVPIVFVGAAAFRVSGSSSPTALEPLETALPEGREDWAEASGMDNSVPQEALPDAGTISFFQTFFEASVKQKVTLGVDATVPTKAWLNGEELFVASGNRLLRPNYQPLGREYFKTVELNPGFNELVVMLNREQKSPPAQCHILLSSGEESSFHAPPQTDSGSADVGLFHGQTKIGRTRFPEDGI
jgi:ADP-ribosylglycohydrolase